MMPVWLAALGTLAAPASPAFQCPDGSPPPCVTRVARASAVATHSVAVLYFDNDSPDTADAYLASGLTEEITTRLGQNGRFQVTSRATMRRYRGAAVDPAALSRALRVSWLVSGSVRRSGRRLRVGVELVRARDGVQAWSRSYDRSSDDLLAIEADIARDVATAIAGRLLPAERASIEARAAVSPAAYDRFLRGNHLTAQRTPQSLTMALSEYEAAVRLDSTFSRAWSRLAHVYGLAAWRMESVRGLEPDSSWRLALSHSARAVGLDPGSSDAWMARGVALIAWPESLAAAHRALARAVEIDSANAEARHLYAWTFAYGGRIDQAFVQWHRALALEPHRPITLTILAQMWFGTNLDSARHWVDSALALEPSFIQGLVGSFMIGFQRGEFDAALAVVDRLVALNFDRQYTDALRALVAARRGDQGPLARVAAAPPSSDVLSRILAAQILLEAGRLDEAADMLDRIPWQNSLVVAQRFTAPLDRLPARPGVLPPARRFAPLP